jgi:hypothetical protein
VADASNFDKIWGRLDCKKLQAAIKALEENAAHMLVLEEVQRNLRRKGRR